MDRFQADHFDGRTSGRRRVEVVVAGGRAIVRGDGLEAEYAVADLQVQPRLGSTPHRIHLPDGGLLVTQDRIGDVIAVPRSAGLAHRLESRMGFVAIALVGLVFTFWLGHQYGVPWLAREVAFRVPPDLEAEIAREGMETLDRHVFKPSALAPARQAELRSTFTQLTTAGVVPAAIEFRDGGFLGANAFALPGGIVVVTDQLVALLGDEGRIAAVLAHEVGHLEHRHGTRHILQDSITGLFLAAVLGDASSIGSLVATLPVVLSHTANSREFEREADTFAYGIMRKTGRSPRLLGEALALLEQHAQARGEDCPVPLETLPGSPPPEQSGGDGAKEDSTKKPRRSAAANLGYLSTHPPTEERIRAAEEAALVR
jgi:Zn-dependent protease with chaperone function